MCPRHKYGLETEAQRRQVAGAGSLSKVGKTHHPLARELAQRLDLELAPEDAPRESEGAGCSPGAFQRGGAKSWAVQGAGRPGGGAVRQCL